MPYVDLAGLSRYASRQKDRLERDCALLRDMQWLRTDKAGAVSLWPVGGTPLKPVVDFLFTEVPPASGDKGPENPSTITGVSSVRVGRIGGKNLLAYNFSTGIVSDGTPWGVNPTVMNNAGTYTIVGTHTGAGVKNYYIVHVTDEKVVIPAGTYTISGYTAPSGAPTATGFQVAWYNPETGSQINNYRLTSGSYTFTVDRPVALNVYFRTASNTTYPDGFTCSPQLEFGDTATAFEPSKVDLYDIPLGSIYYGGTLDVASGVMTVTWWGLVLDGTEDWISIGSGTYYGYKIIVSQLAPSGSALAPVYNTERCTHFDIQNSVSLSSQHAIVYGNSFAVFTTQNTLASFKQWVADQKTAGHPLSVVYPLAEPIIVQLTPTEILSLTQTDKYTPRLNTLYTDAQAVQVGYVKSPIRDEYELQQAVIAQGGNV